MSRQCFRLYINDLGSWMFSNLSRSEYIVNEDTICSKYCKHNQESLISVALHPERANLIRVSGIEVSVRVPTGSCKNGPGPWVLRERLRLFPDTSSQSTGSSTTQALMGRRSMPLSSTPKLRNTYHELQASAVQGRFYMIKTLVDKKTGSRLLGKIDNNANDDVLTREENLSKTLKSLLRICTDTEYFVRHLEIKDLPSGRAIITEYRDARLLEEVDGLNTSDSLLIFAQIGGQALRYLDGQDLVHNDIRASTILIEHSNQTLSARLTGFSNMQALRDTVEKDKSTDVRAIANVVRHMQSAEQSDNAISTSTLYAENKAKRNDTKRKYAAIEDETLKSKRGRASSSGCTQERGADPSRALYSPSLERLVSRALGPGDACPSPRDIQEAFRHAIGGDRVRWPAFDFITFRRTYTFNCFKQDGENFVQLDQIIEVVSEQSQILSLSRGLFQLCRYEPTQGTEYLSFESALKLLHANSLFGLRGVFLEKDAERSSNDDGTFVLEFVASVQITCHRPSSMINLTQLSRIAGVEAREALRKTLKLEGLQEIHGHREWKGIYSNPGVLESVFRESNKELSDQLCNLRFSNEDPYFDLNLRDIRHAEYTVVAFPRLQPHLVLVRRKDFQVNTASICGEVPFHDTRDANFSSCKTAVQACQELDLKDLASCLARMEETTNTPDWKSKVYLNHKTVPTVKSVSEATSLMTSSSLIRAKKSYMEDPEAFRFKRRSSLRKDKTRQVRSPPSPKPRILQRCQQVTLQVPTLSTNCISPLSSEDPIDSKANVAAWLSLVDGDRHHCP